MAKIIYETTLLVCSSCVIFTGTVSAVLLMLAWPNDRILGLSTRLVITLCVVIVGIFSVGFVATIAESIRALLLYACLLILFPVSVLLVEIILRLTTMSPAVAVSSSPPDQTLSATPKSTLIFSNSFTSLGQPFPGPSGHNFSTDSIAASPLPSLSALLPPPTSSEVKFNLSLTSSTPLPTDFYLLFKDDAYDNAPSQSNRQVKAPPDNITESSSGGPSQPKSTFLKATGNFWAEILTTSLSPRVETLVEYVLIGMLAFVLLQIGIAYLLASEIRTLRTELAMLASMQFNKRRAEQDKEEVANLAEETNLVHFDKNQIVSGFCEFECLEPVPSELPLNYPASSDCSANFASDYCLLTFQQALPLVQVHANPDCSAIPSEASNSFNSNYVNVIIDESLANKPTQFASSLPPSSSLTSKANRRNRMGSFRVTFDSAPEYFESSNESYGEAILAPATVQENFSQCQQPSQQQQQQEPEQQHHYQP